MNFKKEAMLLIAKANKYGGLFLLSLIALTVLLWGIVNTLQIDDLPFPWLLIVGGLGVAFLCGFYGKYLEGEAKKL